LVTDQLELLQRSYEQIAGKKTTETDLLTKDLNLAAIRERDLRNRLNHLENELGDIKEQARTAIQELDLRTKENDHLVSLLEDQEQRISLYEEKEKSIHALANDSKKRIEDANLERDRVLLKEQQYLAKIARIEDLMR
jgi:regulator of replication initiation timing